MKEDDGVILSDWFVVLHPESSEDSFSLCDPMDDHDVSVATPDVTTLVRACEPYASSV